MKSYNTLSDKIIITVLITLALLTGGAFTQSLAFDKGNKSNTPKSVKKTAIITPTATPSITPSVTPLPTLKPMTRKPAVTITVTKVAEATPTPSTSSGPTATPTAIPTPANTIAPSPAPIQTGTISGGYYDFAKFDSNNISDDQLLPVEPDSWFGAAARTNDNFGNSMDGPKWSIPNLPPGRYNVSIAFNPNKYQLHVTSCSNCLAQNTQYAQFEVDLHAGENLQTIWVLGKSN